MKAFVVLFPLLATTILAQTPNTMESCVAAAQKAATRFHIKSAIVEAACKVYISSDDPDSAETQAKLSAAMHELVIKEHLLNPSESDPSKVGVRGSQSAACTAAKSNLADIQANLTGARLGLEAFGIGCILAPETVAFCAGSFVLEGYVTYLEDEEGIAQTQLTLQCSAT